MHSKSLNIGALFSFLTFLLINLLMFFTTNLVAPHELIRTVLIAVVLYAIPIGLTYLRFQFAYHLLGVVMVCYTVAFVTVIALVTDGQINLFVRILTCGLGLIGVLISAGWFKILYDNSRQRVRQRLNKHKLK